MSQQQPGAPTILRRKQVESRTGLSCSTLYLRMSEGTFPKSISLGDNSVGWIEAEINCWIEQRIKQSRQAA